MTALDCLGAGVDTHPDATDVTFFSPNVINSKEGDNTTAACLQLRGMRVSVLGARTIGARAFNVYTGIGDPAKEGFHRIINLDHYRPVGYAGDQSTTTSRIMGNAANPGLRVEVTGRIRIDGALVTTSNTGTAAELNYADVEWGCDVHLSSVEQATTDVMHAISLNSSTVRLRGQPLINISGSATLSQVPRIFSVSTGSKLDGDALEVRAGSISYYIANGQTGTGELRIPRLLYDVAPTGSSGGFVNAGSMTASWFIGGTTTSPPESRDNRVQVISTPVNRTLLNNDSGVFVFDGAVAADITITLPSTRFQWGGMLFRFVRTANSTGAGNILIKSSGGTTIATLSGASSRAAVSVASGSVWYQIA